jgi:dephospho-CoA kinase
MSKNKLICLVGMPGAGKSEVADYMRKQRNFGYFRFGQIVLDKVKESGQPSTEKLEREIREAIRAEHGMAAMAILNLPKMEELLKTGDVIGDGLYSWEEYLFLKEKFGDDLAIVAICAPPKVRYARLVGRAERHGNDPSLRFRSFTLEEVVKRDYAEIENAHKAGPIAMADYIVINNCSIEELYTQVDDALTRIFE